MVSAVVCPCKQEGQSGCHGVRWLVGSPPATGNPTAGTMVVRAAGAAARKGPRSGGPQVPAAARVPMRGFAHHLVHIVLLVLFRTLPHVS